MPDIEIGDRWEYETGPEEARYNLIIEVTAWDEEDQTFSIKMTVDPPIEGLVREVVAKFDSELMFPVWSKATGTSDGTPVSMETEATYEIISGARWPLEVGKEVQISESITFDLSMGDETQSETTTEIKTYKVEALEEVTVPAGTFECFKISEYNETGEKITTTWHSDKVKINVKEIDYEVDETQVLTSYSVN